MFTQFIELLTGGSASSQADAPDKLQVAVAALLVQAALMDDQFGEAERAVIERLLAARFGLATEDTRRLLESGEQAVDQSNQLFAFTKLAAEQLDPDERIQLIEMLWEVAYADGVLDPNEDALVRRIAGLVYVSDRDRGAARNRVLERRQAGPNPITGRA
jgi:uncharacterized tellurite resistance protein B-like protein